MTVTNGPDPASVIRSRLKDNASILVGRFVSDRAPLPAISLAANTSTVTAIGNDYSFEGDLLEAGTRFGTAW